MSNNNLDVFYKYVFNIAILIALVAVILLRILLTGWLIAYRTEIKVTLMISSMLGLSMCVIGGVLCRSFIPHEMSARIYIVGAGLLLASVFTAVALFV